MDKLDNKIRKALKLWNLVQRPTGNPHQDELAVRTFNEFIQKYNISMEELSAFFNTDHEYQFENIYIAELFLMIAVKQAEVRNILNDIKCNLDQKGGVSFSGPGAYCEEVRVLFARYKRKYEITRDDVRKKAEEAAKPQPQSYITIGSGIFVSAGLYSNISSQNVKYSEPAFYTAFLIKYDLFADCMKAAIDKRVPTEPTEEQKKMQDDVNKMFRMFDKESLTDQLE